MMINFEEKIAFSRDCMCPMSAGLEYLYVRCALQDDERYPRQEQIDKNRLGRRGLINA